MPEITDITDPTLEPKTQITAPAGEILRLMATSRAGFRTTPEQMELLESADPTFWFKVDLWYK